MNTTTMRLMMTATKGKSSYTVLFTGAGAYEEAVEFEATHRARGAKVTGKRV